MTRSAWSDERSGSVGSGRRIPVSEEVGRLRAALSNQELDIGRAGRSSATCRHCGGEDGCSSTTAARSSRATPELIPRRIARVLPAGVAGQYDAIRTQYAVRVLDLRPAPPRHRAAASWRRTRSARDGPGRALQPPRSPAAPAPGPGSRHRSAPPATTPTAATGRSPASPSVRADAARTRPASRASRPAAGAPPARPPRRTQAAGNARGRR